VRARETLPQSAKSVEKMIEERWQMRETEPRDKLINPDKGDTTKVT